MRALFLLALFSSVIACGPDDRVRARDSDSGPDVGAPLDVPVLDVPVADVRFQDSGPSVCLSGTTTVDVELDINIEQGCAIWNSLDELAGEAVVSRAGRVISIDFGGSVLFGGTVDGSEVELEYVHPHPFEDGCGWEARETFVGSFAGDCTLTLSYDYRESVVINRGGCAMPCSANADVSLLLTPLI